MTHSQEDAVIAKRLTYAGAVLVAKLSLGARLNDIWFGGQTMNSWLLQRLLGIERRSSRRHGSEPRRLRNRKRDRRHIVSPSTRCSRSVGEVGTSNGTELWADENSGRFPFFALFISGSSGMALIAAPIKVRALSP